MSAHKILNMGCLLNLILKIKFKCLELPSFQLQVLLWYLILKCKCCISVLIQKWCKVEQYEVFLSSVFECGGGDNLGNYMI